MDVSRTELKVTIAKLIEVAYSQDKGVTSKIVRSKGPFRLEVDQDGNARLSGVAGTLTFSGATTLDRIGANIRAVSISFSSVGGSKVTYHAEFDLKVAKIGVSGGFDVEELITSCSGLLCQAARAMKRRHQLYELELQKIMGH